MSAIRWDRDRFDVHVDYSDSRFQTWRRCVNNRKYGQQREGKDKSMDGERGGMIK